MNKDSSVAEPEIEVKFFDVDLEDVRSKLKADGATLKAPERLMRRAIFGAEANKDMTCTYGRVRDEGNIVTMSAKFSAVNGDITSQKEAMLVVDNFDVAISILQSFGLTQTNYQENKRETWELPDGTLVELETWPELPPYLEIEGSDVDTLRKSAELLGLVWDEHIVGATGTLYERHLGLTAPEVQKKIADLHF